MSLAVKTLALAILLFSFSLSPGYGQSPAPHRHSVSFEAQSVTNGGTTTVTSNSSDGIQSLQPVFGGDRVDTHVTRLHDQHDTVHRTNVRVDIRNLARTADNLRLEWYFVAASVGGRSKDFVFDRGTQDVIVAPNGTETRIITSKEARNVLVRSTTTIQSADDTTDVSFYGGGNSRGQSAQGGIIMRGWVVRLLDNGQVVATRGSSQTYEDLAKDDAKLKTLLEQP